MIQTDLYSFCYKKGSLVPICKRCGAQHFYRNGKNRKGVQRYRCRDCGFRFIWTSDLPNRRFFSSVMSFAVEIYTDLRKAISLRGIAELLKKLFNVDVTYEGVRGWVKTSEIKVFRRENPRPTTWHADETYFKVKGAGYWLWIVYDRENVLAWHISKGRFYKDARRVMGDALKAAGCRPEKIITDGLYQYQAAIKNVIGWNWRVQKERHIIDSGIGKNAYIERLNREIKRRLKWFSTFQSMKGARIFFGLWFHHYNLRKSAHPG